MRDSLLLLLLMDNVTDIVVRTWACLCLSALPLTRLHLLLPALISILRHEPVEDGPVSRLLLFTAARHLAFASQVYWGLAAAADAAASGLAAGGASHARVLVALQAAVLAGSGSELRWMVLNQHRTVACIERCCRAMAEMASKSSSANASSKDTRALMLKTRVSSLAADLAVAGVGGWSVPHDARHSGGPFLQESCRVMDSKKTPMMMEFSSVGHSVPLAVMFKAGDDLRQDHVMMKLFEM